MQPSQSMASIYLCTDLGLLVPFIMNTPILGSY